MPRFSLPFLRGFAILNYGRFLLIVYIHRERQIVVLPLFCYSSFDKKKPDACNIERFRFVVSCAENDKINISFSVGFVNHF